MQNLPILYHRAKSGKLHSWKIWTEDNIIYSEAGTDAGKKILSSRIATPKNEGKKNATTASEQAEKEAIAMHKNKLERKYSLTPEEAIVVDELQPMLAQDYYKKKNKVIFPAIIQPKLDGCRAVAVWEDDKIVLKSRGNKYWENMEHIIKELEHILPKGKCFDGELYIHDKSINFQTLCSWIKRKQPDTLRIEYHVYDFINPALEETMNIRNNELEEIFRKHNSSCGILRQETWIKKIPSYVVNNEEEVEKYHSQFVLDGYEGGMLRILNSIYEWGYRSNGLLKIKNFQDEEFKVIGYNSGFGKFHDQVIWICENEDGVQFNVIPSCTQEEKREFLKNGDKYIGKWLTVQYFGKSQDNIVRFPVGKGFKPDKEFFS